MPENPKATPSLNNFNREYKKSPDEHPGGMRRKDAHKLFSDGFSSLADEEE